MANPLEGPPRISLAEDGIWRNWFLNLYNAVNSIDAVTTTTTTVTGTYTVLSTDELILVDDDAAGGAVTVSLPAISGVADYHIKKLGSTGDVIIDGNASETIDDGLTATLKVQYESVHIISDGSSWHVV